MNNNIHDNIDGWILTIIVLLILLMGIFVTGYGSIVLIESTIYDIEVGLFTRTIWGFTGSLCVVLCIGLLHKLYQFFIEVIFDKSEES